MTRAHPTDDEIAARGAMPVTRRVEVVFDVGIRRCQVSAIMGPAEPEVGILLPYPLAIDVRDARGSVVPLGGPDHRLLLDALRTAYYALEVPHAARV